MAGKYRLIDIPISNCINSNINKMYVMTQFNSASLNRHLSQTFNLSASFGQGFVEVLLLSKRLTVLPGLKALQMPFVNTNGCSKNGMLMNI